MVLHGDNLIITSTDSGMKSMVAASKSCSINMDVDTTEVANPTNGYWKQYKTGRKSWKITCDWLVPYTPYEVLELKSDSFDTLNGYGYDIIKGDKTSYSDNSFHLIAYSFDGNYVADAAYDIANPNGTLCALYDDFLEGNPIATNAIFLVNASNRAVNYGTDGDIWGKIKTTFGISFTNPSANSAFNLALASLPRLLTSPEVYFKTGRNSAATVQVPIVSWAGWQLPSYQTLVKNRLLAVGSSYYVSMRVNKGLVDEKVLGGLVICTSAKITARKGSLLQGDFEFIGNGILE